MTATELDWVPDQHEVVLERPPSLRARLLGGAAAGMVATVPMTLLMVRLHRDLPPPERHPLPPRHITERLAEAAGVEDEFSEPEMRALTLGSHFGYGAAAGAVYALASPLLRGPSPASGVAFGLALWVASYMGWLPATGMLPPAGDESPRRNRLMVAAHVAWGTAAGVLAGLLVRPRRTPVRHAS